MLATLGFAKVSWAVGKKISPYWVEVRNDVSAVLASRRPPLLLLEDDATLLPQNYRADVECPQGADVLYLGGTLNAESFSDEADGLVRRGGGHMPWPLVYAEYDEKHVRIFNMHSTHAILFINEAAMNAFQTSIARNPGVAVDVCFAREMSRWTTLLVKRPFWCQRDGRNDALTRNYYPPRIEDQTPIPGGFARFRPPLRRSCAS